MASTITVTGVLNFAKMTICLPSIPLLVGYVLMFTVSGLWQRWTSPFDLRLFLIVHNLGCCLANAATCGGFTYSLFMNGSIYGRTSEPFLAQVYKLYWITKVVELLDTVFMVLRHEQRQISFLHMYQHASLLLISDMARLFFQWPSIATFLTINSLAHVFQYLFVGLLHLNPDDPPQWKKGMAQFQLIQSFAILFLAINGYRHRNFCGYCIFYGFTLLVLFLNSYIQEFLKTQPAKTDLRKRL